MTDPVYVELFWDEALQAKRTLLSSRRNIIKITKAIKEYKKLRKVDLIKRALLRKKLIDIKRVLSILSKELPEVDEKFTHIEKAQKPARKPSNLEKELKDIEKQLAKLQ